MLGICSADATRTAPEMSLDSASDESAPSSLLLSIMAVASLSESSRASLGGSSVDVFVEAMLVTIASLIASIACMIVSFEPYWEYAVAARFKRAHRCAAIASRTSMCNV